MIKHTILVVEDENKIRDLIISYLEDKYTVFEAQDGLEALEIFEEERIDLIISDVMMPQMDGWQLLAKVREKSSVPFILLTALDDEDYQLKGFDLKADDYITKPFSLKVFVKKVESIFRRDSLEFESLGVINAGIIKVDTLAKSVYVNEKEIHLMPKEYDLLLLFLENQNEALNRDDILDRIWGNSSSEKDPDPRVVDTHIKKLRQKLGDAKSYIKTQFGTGYKFRIDNTDK